MKQFVRKGTFNLVESPKQCIFVLMNIDYKNWNEKSGIYKITNLTNSKCYIGQASNLYDRLHTHKYLLKLGKSHNKHLQYAYNKYGLESFTCEVLEFCGKDLTTEREQYWIDLLKPEYNKNYTVTEPHIPVFTDEMRRKASEKQKEIEANREYHPSFKTILIYDLEGNFLKEVLGLTNFAKELGVRPKVVTKALKYHTGRYKKYQLRYKEGDNRPVGKYKQNNNKPNWKLTKDKEEKVCKLRKDGISVKEIAKLLDLSESYITVITRRNKVFKTEEERREALKKSFDNSGRTKIKIDEHKMIEQMSKEGKSQREIARIYSVSTSCISLIMTKIKEGGKNVA